MKEEAENKVDISFILNGEEKNLTIKSSLLLLDLIRDELGLIGTKPGCNEGECGACTVLVNNMAVNSCLFPAVNVQGKQVITIEGISNHDHFDPVQEAMIEKGAVQCGFCTSGMVMSIKEMEYKSKKSNSSLPMDEIKKGLEGNLCRCTGYVKILEAADSVINPE
jgi:aerobic-type carbon monoxide dehydrogenase small subunit (CoxS/CutS family)